MMRVDAKYKDVPSLYVRVYQAAFLQVLLDSGSLTIREGVSLRVFFLVKIRQFPHYT